MKHKIKEDARVRDINPYLRITHTYDKTPERLFACVSELLTVNVPKLVFSQSY